MTQRKELRHEGVMPGDDHKDWRKRKNVEGLGEGRKEGNGGTNEQK